MHKLEFFLRNYKESCIYRTIKPAAFNFLKYTKFLFALEEKIFSNAYKSD